MFVAPVLPADVIATAKILEDAGLLQSLVTRGVITSSQRVLLQQSPLAHSYSRRAVSPVSASRTTAIWFADVLFFAFKAITQSRIRASDAAFAYVDAVAAKRVHSPVSAVFAREDCCFKTFDRAKKLGLKRIYQLPTAYWEQVKDLMETEEAQFAGVGETSENAVDFAKKRTERKTAELDSAQYVLCPSSFVRDSLPEHRRPIAKTIPFAIDTNGESNPLERKRVFLYAGNITMRKGIHRLLLAWRRLNAYRTHELRLVGDMFLSEKFLGDFRGMFTHIPRVSSAELNRHYAEASAFVFNAMADGFGHVFLEAMSHAVPVIASKNCGAPDVIEHGRNGLLIDYGSDEQLDAALDHALSRPSEIAALGREGYETVCRRAWSDYGRELLDWLNPILA